MNLLTDDEIYTAYIEAANQTLRPQDDRIALGFARAIIAATVAKLAAGVSVEPWTTTKYVSSTIQYELYTRAQLQTAIAAAHIAAHIAGRKSVHDKCVDLWKDEFLAAARVQAINECADILAEYDCLNSGMGRDIRALIGGST